MLKQIKNTSFKGKYFIEKIQKCQNKQRQKKNNFFQFEKLIRKYESASKGITNFNYYQFSTSRQFDSNKDYYQILKLSEKANQLQIKTQFYKLAKQFHPDNCKGGQQSFKQINQAYQILGNEDKKKIYDKFRLIKRQNTQNQNQQKHNNKFQNHQANNQTKSPYYNYSKSQWATIRQGFTYVHYTESYINQNLTQNTHSASHIFKKFAFRKEHQQQIQKQAQQLIEKEIIYQKKIKEKQKKDRQDYYNKRKKLQQQIEQEKQKKFKQSWFGKIYLKVTQLLKYQKRNK